MNKYKINRKGKVKEEDTVLCEGIVLGKKVYNQKERRIYTFLLKGFMVYLLVAGGVGSYLTAIGSPFNGFVLNAVLLVSSLLLASVYYNSKTENFGYLLLMLVLVFLGIYYRRYINSGFYAVLNDTNQRASVFFKLDGVRSYAEQVANRQLAITAAMCFIGIVEAIILNIYISRKMRYLPAAIVGTIMLLVPLYIHREPGIIYVLMLFSSVIAAYAMKMGGHYVKTRDNNGFALDKNNNLRYIYNWKATLTALVQTTIVVLIVAVAFAIAVPQDRYSTNQKNSGIKSMTMDRVATFVQLGLAGMFNQYDSVGGMNSGVLGGVSSISYDYGTDLKVQFTPYSYDTLYLKYFTGVEYNPYDNIWTREAFTTTEEDAQNIEGADLSIAYNYNFEGSAKGSMIIENVDAVLGRYVPYYVTDMKKSIFRGESMQYDYYPRFSNNPIKIYSTNAYRSIWNEIPEENKDTIAQICETAGFSGTTQQIVNQVTAFFQNNYPYTLSPGATPCNQDFVNYFLTKNKKGYCAHYASAATLIFRYMGIPARYVEGYAVSYSEVLDGSLVDNAEYKDYYDGYSELGETALVEVDVTDADAHAWVEIYVGEEGWVPVDVTPFSSVNDNSSSNNNNGFWSVFMNIFGQQGDQTNNGGQTGDGLSDDTNSMFRNQLYVIKYVLLVLLGTLIVVIVIFNVVYLVKYCRASINDRLIMRYSKLIKRKTRHKKNKALKERYNYRLQLEYMALSGKITPSEINETDMILTKAGFSNRLITKDEFAAAVRILRKL